MLERRALSLDRGATAERQHARVRQRTHEPAQLVCHLCGELACRAQHECAGPSTARRDPRQQRESECDGLAGSRRGLAEHVAALQHGRQGERLDRCHLDVSELPQILDPRRSEVERGELERRHDAAV